MKKFIACAIAAGALAVGGAASAQDFGNVIGNLLGLFLSDTTQQSTTTVQMDPYGRYYYLDEYGRQVFLQRQGYADQYGRQIYVDPYGRQIALQTPRTTGSIVGYDSWGRPIYGNSGQYAYGGQYSGRSWDLDGDGIANSRDRWPNDPRYR